jgi:hypothetical protein
MPAVPDYGSFHVFLTRFVTPLVLGGRVVVDGLVAPGVLRAWTRPVDLDPNAVARLHEAVRLRLARVGPVGRADQLSPDLLALAAVWHDLLAMTHPDVVKKVSLRRKVRQWCTSFLEWAGAPRTRADVALRHGVFGRLGQLGRVDTHVTFWAGYADFLGVAPPATLVALPKLRRVTEEKKRVGFIDLLLALEVPELDESADLLGVVRAALAFSPLTDLSLADRPKPFTFAWMPPALNALADDALRGAALRILLGRGAAALKAVEQATQALTGGSCPASVARLLLRFHLELALLDAMASGRGQDAPPRGPVAPGASPVPSQPLAWDAASRLGIERVAQIVGLDPAVVARALPIDSNRPPVVKEPPSAALLARAGALETSP